MLRDMKSCNSGEENLPGSCTTASKAGAGSALMQSFMQEYLTSIFDPLASQIKDLQEQSAACRSGLDKAVARADDHQDKIVCLLKDVPTLEATCKKMDVDLQGGIVYNTDRHSALDRHHATTKHALGEAEQRVTGTESSVRSLQEALASTDQRLHRIQHSLVWASSVVEGPAPPGTGGGKLADDCSDSQQPKLAQGLQRMKELGEAAHHSTEELRRTLGAHDERISQMGASLSQRSDGLEALLRRTQDEVEKQGRLLESLVNKSDQTSTALDGTQAHLEEQLLQARRSDEELRRSLDNMLRRMGTHQDDHAKLVHRVRAEAEQSQLGRDAAERLTAVVAQSSADIRAHDERARRLDGGLAGHGESLSSAALRIQRLEGDLAVLGERSGEADGRIASLTCSRDAAEGRLVELDRAHDRQAKMMKDLEATKASLQSLSAMHGATRDAVQKLDGRTAAACDRVHALSRAVPEPSRAAHRLESRLEGRLDGVQTPRHERSRVLPEIAGQRPEPQ